MRVPWGISESDIDDFERSDFKPYTGPIPPVGQFYRFKLKIFRYAPAMDGKNPQLRVGLELEPHTTEHERYAGYFIQDYAPVTPQTNFRYVKYLDALGIGAKAFVRGPYRIDDDGNIKRVGRWQFTDPIYLLAKLRATDNEQYPREIGDVYAFDESDEADELADELADEFTEETDDEYADDYDVEEEQPAPRRRKQASTGHSRETRPTRTRREIIADDEW